MRIYFPMLFCILFTLTAEKAYPQDLSFSLREDLNKITDPQNTLSVFYQQLHLLETRKRDKEAQAKQPYQLSIMHIGDSHVQAGFFTVEIMNRLQTKFGNAGRGLIFPLKLAKTNEPFDYLIRSQSKWDRTLCVQGVKKLPMGLGGLAIKSADPEFTFEIKANNKPNNHSFNKITIFHHAKAPVLKVANTEIEATYERSASPFLSVVNLDKNINHLYLTSTLNPDLREKQDSAIYYGFNLENGKSGILYHAVGINGAQFRHYASVQDFSEQISTLEPKLLIFSLGTNEAFRGKLVASRFFGEIDRILQPILAENPEAKVLIITPPDCLSGHTKTTQDSNPNLRDIRKALIQYAEKNEFAYWDLYSVLGGDNSAYPLYQKGYLSTDGIHFRKDGYKLLGKLFVDALLSNYTNYVQH